MSPTGDNPIKPIPADAGIGLRGEHYAAVDHERPAVGWLEVHTENYFGRGGIPHHYLSRLGAHYPLSFHGVGMSLGGATPLDPNHLARVRELVEQYRPGLVSEHLSWSSVGGLHSHDLLPCPLTRESLEGLCRNIDHAQTRLGRSILVENPSTYLAFRDDELAEPEFLNTLARRTGCGILLDVNNVHVCASNHGFDATAYLDAIDAEAVGEIHLAGHVVNTFDDGQLLVDSHNQPVCQAVWQLYRHAVSRTGAVPTLIEWDTDLPPLSVLVDHASEARGILERQRAAA